MKYALSEKEVPYIISVVCVCIIIYLFYNKVCINVAVTCRERGKESFTGGLETAGTLP